MFSDDFREVGKTCDLHLSHVCSTDLLDVRDDGGLGLDVQQLDLLDHLLLTLTLTHTKQKIKKHI